MGDVIVLGGYGRLGLRVAGEIARTTRSTVVVAGRSVQRADQVAAALEGRARGAYAHAADVRTLASLLQGADALIACCGGDWTAALQTALEARVPFIGVGGLRLDARSARTVAEHAWLAQVPIVLQAGAVPGLPGLLAEWMVRRHQSIHELRIASTGPWEGTATARRDLASLRSDGAARTEWIEGRRVRARLRARRWEFAEPVGVRTLRPAHCVDLDGFAEQHLVRNLAYLEPDPGLLLVRLERALGFGPPPGFAAAAEARIQVGSNGAVDRISLVADDALVAAAALVGVIAQALIARRVGAGLWTPRAALNPALAVAALEKSGVRVLVPS